MEDLDKSDTNNTENNIIVNEEELQLKTKRQKRDRKSIISNKNHVKFIIQVVIVLVMM
jgi:hypothetical protein